VNDQFIPYLPHVLEDKGSVGEMKEYKNAWYLEALMGDYCYCVNQTQFPSLHSMLTTSVSCCLTILHTTVDSRKASTISFDYDV
jgi:hypothetical protein